MRLADIMSTQVRTTTPGRPVAEALEEMRRQATKRTTVRDAANLLRGRSIGCLPVLDGARLVGIVTTTDLLELIGRGVEKPIERSTPRTMGRRPDRVARRG